MATPTDHQKQTKEMLLMNMIHMSDDIIAEILSWLPAKSLVRFRWVCKYWFDLITESSDKHLLRSNSCSSRLWGSDYSTFYLTNPNKFKQCYIDYTTGLFLREVTIPNPYIFYTNFRLHGSCHGLVLIEFSSYTSPYVKKLCILNPCTKEYKEIPCAPCCCYKLDTDNYGFGYDRTTDDYKVILVTYETNYYGNNKNIGSILQVYTLGTNSWRSIGSIPYTLLPLSDESGVFVKGALYWRNYSMTKIISFDMGMERFEEITNLPVCFKDNLKNGRLEIFERSLCVMLQIDDPITKICCVEMWVRKDNYYVNNNDKESSWTKLFRTAPFMFLKPVRFTKSGEIVLLDRWGSLFWCDPKNPTSWMAEEQFCTDVIQDEVDIIVHTESLVSLNSGAYAVKKTEQINIHYH